MPVLGWDEALPSDGSAVGNTPPILRSDWTTLSMALGANLLYWPGTAGGSQASIGEMQPGGPRTYFGTFSQSSMGDVGTLRGRLFYASDLSRLLCYDSNGTFLVATAGYLEAPPTTGAYWRSLTGRESISQDSLSVDVTFATPYSVAPTITVAASIADIVPSVSVLTTGGFTSAFSQFGSVSTWTLTWASLGTTGSTP